MSPLPEQMTDRWAGRFEPPHGQGTLYWHMLVGEHANVRELVRHAQERLCRFYGFHLTPEQWLHVTTLIVGSRSDVTAEQLDAMFAEAQRALAVVEPIPVTFGRVLYHPHAVMLGIRPERALDPVFVATREATLTVTGSAGVVNGPFPQWIPHLTIAYSTARQPAGPIIEALGRELPAREAVISSVSLVVQWGPEREWDWEPVGTAVLGTTT